MTESKREITAFGLWSQTLATLRQGLQESLPILLLGLALPSLILGLFLRSRSHLTVNFIKETTDAMLAGHEARDYRVLYNGVAEFATTYLLAFLFLFFLFAVSYVALNLVALKQVGVETFTEPGLKGTLRRALKLSFPRVFLVLFITFLLSAERALLGPIRLFSLLSLLSVCLIITENRGAFSAVWHTLTLRFVKNEIGFGFTVLWLVFSTGALIYIFEHLMNLLITGVKALTEASPVVESFLSYRPDFLPCTVLKLTLDGIQFVGYLFLLLFMVNFISCLYKETVKTLSERS